MLVHKIFGPKKILGLGKNATTKQNLKVILLSTKGKYMKESNTLVGNVENISHQKEMFPNIIREYMKESNIHVGNVEDNSHRKEMLPNIIGKYMKGSNNLAGNAVNNSLRGDILVYTEGQYMKESNTAAIYATTKLQEREV